MHILKTIREEAKEYSKDADFSGAPSDHQDILLTDVARVAYIMGAKSVLFKWERVLYDYVLSTEDTTKQANKKLKELGLK